MLAVLLLLVAVVLAVGCGGSLYLLRQQAAVESRNRSLDVARTLAEDDAVRSAVTAASDADPLPNAQLQDGPMQREAEAVRTRTGALFVVVTDDRGLRLAHPNPALLGRRVSTDPTQALAGREVVTDETGTLGASARAKVPVYAPGSARVVGEVSVGVGAAAVADRARDALWPALAVAAGALVVGLVGADVLARRLRRLTHGLQPEELGGILQAHDAVLHGIAEGVVSLGPDGRVVLANAEAARLLGRPVPAGSTLEDLPTAVRHVVDQPPAVPATAVVGDRALVLSARRVERNGRLLGHVVTVADRTDVELLTRQLDAVRAVGEVLRAQRHEFANRLHLVSGLLETGRASEAGNYVRTLLATGPLGWRVEGLDAVADPYLQAFVAAKAAHARERQVVLALGEVSVAGRVADPVDVTTVLGNLVDNAVAAAVGSAGARVEVDLVQEGSDLVLAVSDSGDGVPEGLRDSVFEVGVTTGDEGHGIGLGLVRQVARSRGGDAWLAPAVPGQGAVFVVRLPGALTPVHAVEVS
ncbi:two-component system CitB family sensor kinase [Kineococcus rhizosphaerae]|uniref:histidine kinase n=1 Tax=Kineococcus rhizosphaerae TaxID=559628 RepID=A0A2T0RAT9_9ACTN|nr:two-component system CitB family sensor kinase [Kineococcus rhizosphaerae]